MVLRQHNAQVTTNESDFLASSQMLCDESLGLRVK